MSAGHATIDGIRTACGLPLDRLTLRGGVDCAGCLAALSTRRPAPRRRATPARSRRVRRPVDPYAVGFWVVVIFTLTAGIVGLALTQIVPGVG